MARQVRQTLPDPPPEYDQQYIAALARSVNNYMGQAQALAQVVAARYIMTDPPLDTTTGLPVGTLYLKTVNGIPLLTVVLRSDP